jgi:anti-anti-sigma factor
MPNLLEPQVPRVRVLVADIEPAAVRMRLEGAMDASAASLLRAWTARLRHATSGNVVLDCSTLSSIDAAGIRLLGELIVSLNDCGRTVELRALSGRLRTFLVQSGALHEWTNVLVEMPVRRFR